VKKISFLAHRKVPQICSESALSKTLAAQCTYPRKWAFSVKYIDRLDTGILCSGCPIQIANIFSAVKSVDLLEVAAIYTSLILLYQNRKKGRTASNRVKFSVIVAGDLLIVVVQ
jgi:hypothetical protein